MTGNLINRYVWFVDTLLKYGRLTREELGELWLDSPWSDGRPIPERTFYHYRRGVERNFHIGIGCDSSGRYYIEESSSPNERAFINWLLNTHSAAAMMDEESGDVSEYVIFEEVPSARRFLPVVMESIRRSQTVTFTYAGFSRSRPETGITMAPWALRLYKQRWYMIGRRKKGDAVRTYALDRITAMTLDKEKFERPEGLDAQSLFKDLVGITSSKAEPRTVRLRADHTQAKYLRALPLHSSQQEEVGSGYSVFTYQLKINYELVHEILALGPQVKVLEPRELRAMVVDELRKTLLLYESGTSNDTSGKPCPII